MPISQSINQLKLAPGSEQLFYLSGQVQSWYKLGAASGFILALKKSQIDGVIRDHSPAAVQPLQIPTKLREDTVLQPKFPNRPQI